MSIFPVGVDCAASDSILRGSRERRLGFELDFVFSELLFRFWLWVERRFNGFRKKESLNPMSHSEH